MGTIRKVKELAGFALSARDGEIGRLTEVHFDDAHWVVRYLVVRTGGWLRGRDVLIAPRAVLRANEADGVLEVDLAWDQVARCPPVDTSPASRDYEGRYHRHYGWRPYWSDPSGALPPQPLPPGPVPAPIAASEGTPKARLRSSDAVVGHHIHAKDGSIGHVEDLLVDDGDWRVRYLEVDTRKGWPGRKVLIAPAWIERVGWTEREVFVTLTREAIRSAPAYDPSEKIGPDDEIRLFEHYGRWAAEE